MKILYISKVDISKTDGPAINERGFIPLLHKLIGLDAHFLIPKPQNQISKDISLNAVTFFESSKGRKPLPWLKQQFTLIKEANKLLKGKEFDLIILRPEIFDFAFNHLLKKHQTPYAIKTAGSGEFNVFKRKNRILRSLYKINQKQYIKLIKGAVLVDMVSKKQQRSVRKLTGENHKIVWIDNGVNVEWFKPLKKRRIRNELGLQRFDPIIGYAGNYPWKRGAMQMVKALPKLKEKYPNIGGLIIGSGKKMHELKKKAKELQVEEHCIFTGQIPFEEVPNYVNCFDIGISQLYEDEQGASEQKVRQYIACGKPLIVSPGGVNDFVEENNFGYITDPLDENAFYKAVDQLLSLDELTYNTLSTKIRTYAEDHLSYTSKVKERLHLYKEILS